LVLAVSICFLVPKAAAQPDKYFQSHLPVYRVLSVCRFRIAGLDLASSFHPKLPGLSSLNSCLLKESWNML
jgi:hypothetical protein